MSSTPYQKAILVPARQGLRRLVRVIKLLQKFPEPGRVFPDDIDQKYGGEGQKKNGQVQQENGNANQDPLFFTHGGLSKANELN